MLRDSLKICCLAALLWAAGTKPPLSEEAGGLLWVYAAPVKILFAPTVSGDGTSYFATDDQQVRAVSPSGQLLWDIDAGGKPTTGIALQGGLLFFGTSQAELAAYSTDGHMAWRTKVDDIIVSTPAVAADGTVYTGTRKGTLYAVNPKGTIKWIYETGSGVVFSPAVAHSSQIYVGSARNFFVFNPGGAPAWIKALATAPGSQIAIDAADGICYLDASGTLHHMDSKLSEDWTATSSTFAASPVVSSPVTSGDKTVSYVYVCEGTAPPPPPSGHAILGTVTLSGGGGGLAGVTVTASITGGTGGTATTNSDGTFSIGSLDNGAYTVTPTLNGYTFIPTSLPVTVQDADMPNENFVATASSPGQMDVRAEVPPPRADDEGANQITAYSLKDGTSLWTKAFGTRSVPAVVSGASVLIPSNDSTLYVFDPTGTETKAIPLDQPPQDIVLATIEAENRIYVVVGDRYLFCLSTSAAPDFTAPWNQLGAGPRHLGRRDDPPTVSITSPTDPNVSGPVTLGADPMDDFPGSLTVRFLVDGAIVATVKGPPFQATWDSSAFPDGQHTLVAEAKDSAGNAARADMTLQVTNSNPPILVYAESPPLTFSWNPGSSTKFKAQVSASPAFSQILAGSGRPGHPWLTTPSWTPDAGTWKRILGAGNKDPTADTIVFWRALGHPNVPLKTSTFTISKAFPCGNLSPADASPVTADQPPAFSWSAEHNAKFMVQVSDAADGFHGGVKLASKWLQDTTWTPAASDWKNLAGQNKGKSLYWRVVGKDAIGRISDSDVNSMAVQQ